MPDLREGVPGASIGEGSTATDVLAAVFAGHVERVVVVFGNHGTEAVVSATLKKREANGSAGGKAGGRSGGLCGGETGKAARSADRNRRDEHDEGGQGARPRSLKKLAIAFDQLANKVMSGAIDVPKARVILSALDREFRCLEMQLRYGKAASTAWRV